MGNKMWQELEQTNLENKERYIEAFRNLLKQIQDEGNINNKSRNYILINETIKGEPMITLVPNSLINLFKKMRAQAPNEFLGFSVLVNGTRVSCFGVSCSELGKVVIGR